jgi:hypothetical protein
MICAMLSLLATRVFITSSRYGSALYKREMTLICSDVCYLWIGFQTSPRYMRIDSARVFAKAAGLDGDEMLAKAMLTDMHYGVLHDRHDGGCNPISQQLRPHTC